MRREERTGSRFSHGLRHCVFTEYWHHLRLHDYGDFLQLRFELPSGCYATVLLREITKQDD